MGTEYKDVYVNMEDSGNSCGSSVISELSGGSDQIDVFDGDGVLVSDFETDTDNDEPLPISQVCAFRLFFSYLRLTFITISTYWIV